MAGSSSLLPRGGALYHRQILLCSCSLLVCLFLIPHLFQGRKRAPAASPLRAAPALPGGDAGGAACPSACCGHTSCVASGRRQPRFPGVPLPKSFDQGRARSRAHVSCNPSFPAHPLLRGKGKFIRAAVRGAPHHQAGLGTEQYFCSCAAARIRSCTPRFVSKELCVGAALKSNEGGEGELSQGELCSPLQHFKASERPPYLDRCCTPRSWLLS